MLIAFLATAHAAWPRLETGATWYRAVHVPKSGGTTHDRALVAVYCFTYNRLDVALYRNATAIWCAEWYRAIRDRESCVRTYSHARPGTPVPCRR